MCVHVCVHICGGQREIYQSQMQVCPRCQTETARHSSRHIYLMSHFASAMRHFLAVSVTQMNSGALIIILLHHILYKSCLSVDFNIIFVFVFGTMGGTEQKLRLLSNSSFHSSYQVKGKQTRQAFHVYSSTSLLNLAQEK